MSFKFQAQTEEREFQRKDGWAINEKTKNDEFIFFNFFLQFEVEQTNAFATKSKP